MWEEEWPETIRCTFAGLSIPRLVGSAILAGDVEFSIVGAGVTASSGNNDDSLGEDEGYCCPSVTSSCSQKPMSCFIMGGLTNDTTSESSLSSLMCERGISSGTCVMMLSTKANMACCKDTGQVKVGHRCAIHVLLEGRVLTEKPLVSSLGSLSDHRGEGVCLMSVKSSKLEVFSLERWYLRMV